MPAYLTLASGGEPEPAQTHGFGGATPNQVAWLARGLEQPGGKLPLFDGDGRRISERTVRSCIEHGWAEPWFPNPIKPDWQICRLTETGRRLLAGD